MILLRRVIGDALRARRQSQHRTLREVSTAANVSLGYLSEIERGQKEASSELLAAICDALGAQLSELLREASQTVEVAENHTTVPARPNVPAAPALVGPVRRDEGRRGRRTAASGESLRFRGRVPQVLGGGPQGPVTGRPVAASRSSRSALSRAASWAASSAATRVAAAR